MLTWKFTRKPQWLNDLSPTAKVSQADAMNGLFATVKTIRAKPGPTNPTDWKEHIYYNPISCVAFLYNQMDNLNKWKKKKETKLEILSGLSLQQILWTRIYKNYSCNLGNCYDWNLATSKHGIIWLHALVQ